MPASERASRADSRRGAFIARWSRETGEALSPVATDRMRFSYEMGYLRGRSDAMQEAMTMFDAASRASEQPGKASEESDDDDTDAK